MALGWALAPAECRASRIHYRNRGIWPSHVLFPYEDGGTRSCSLDHRNSRIPFLKSSALSISLILRSNAFKSALIFGSSLRLIGGDNLSLHQIILAPSSFILFSFSVPFARCASPLPASPTPHELLLLAPITVFDLLINHLLRLGRRLSLDYATSGSW